MQASIISAPRGSGRACPSICVSGLAALADVSAVHPVIPGASSGTEGEGRAGRGAKETASVAMLRPVGHCPMRHGSAASGSMAFSWKLIPSGGCSRLRNYLTTLCVWFGLGLGPLRGPNGTTTRPPMSHVAWLTGRAKDPGSVSGRAQEWNHVAQCTHLLSSTSNTHGRPARPTRRCSLFGSGPAMQRPSFF